MPEQFRLSGKIEVDFQTAEAELRKIDSLAQKAAASLKTLGQAGKGAGGSGGGGGAAKQTVASAAASTFARDSRDITRQTSLIAGLERATGSVEFVVRSS